MKKIDIVSLVAYVAGFGIFIGNAVFASAMHSVLCPRLALADPCIPANVTVNFLSGVIILAGLITQVIGKKAGAPATAITSDAKVVAPGTEVVHHDTPSVGTNTVAVIEPPASAGQNGATP